MIIDNKENKKNDFEAQIYKNVAEYLGEEVFVTNGDGQVIFVNSASLKFLGLPLDQIIGKNAQELEQTGCFSQSVSMEVLKTGKKADIIQSLRDGRTVLATGVPVYDENGKISMVISTSKDVEAVNKLLRTVDEQQEEIKSLRDNVFSGEEFVSADPAMDDIKQAIAKIAPMDIPVLVLGETGVGKEVVVKSIHRFSERQNGPLFKINCGTIPENLIESELFGYEKGAFTGAEKTGKKGKIEMASGGTLFLDEIGELPLSMQVKLLDFLQERTIVRVGGVREIKVDVRVVAATNRNLKEMCEKKLFRQDLYYRLNVMPLYIPALRDRLIDIETLTKHFVKKYNVKYNDYKHVDREFIDILKKYAWPGNVRELEHVIERVYVMSNGDTLSNEYIQHLLREETPDALSGVVCYDILPLKAAKHDLERQLVLKAYEIYGSTYKAADALDVDQSTVAKILKRIKGDDKSEA